MVKINIQSIYIVVVFDEKRREVLKYAGPVNGEAYIEHKSMPYGVPYKQWEGGVFELVNWIKREKPHWDTYEQIVEVNIEVINKNLNVNFKKTS